MIVGVAKLQVLADELAIIAAYKRRKELERQLAQEAEVPRIETRIRLAANRIVRIEDVIKADQEAKRKIREMEEILMLMVM